MRRFAMVKLKKGIHMKGHAELTEEEIDILCKDCVYDYKRPKAEDERYFKFMALLLKLKKVLE